jgi:hypothetical protein
MAMPVRKRTGRVKRAAPPSRDAAGGTASSANGGGGPAPVFRRCRIIGPDGIERAGWELWVGASFFGRAESKAVLLEYFARAQMPLPAAGVGTDSSWYVPRPRANRRAWAEDAAREIVEAWD